MRRVGVVVVRALATAASALAEGVNPAMTSASESRPARPAAWLSSARRVSEGVAVAIGVVYVQEAHPGAVSWVGVLFTYCPTGSSPADRPAVTCLRAPVASARTWNTPRRVRPARRVRRAPRPHRGRRSQPGPNQHL